MPETIWAAPAFWDIQINGRWGHSFSSPDLTVEQVAEIVRAQASPGHGAALPDPDHGPSGGDAPRSSDHRGGLRGLSRRRADGPGHSPGRPVPLGVRRLSRGAPERGHPRSRLGPVRGAAGGVRPADRPGDAGPGAAGSDRVHPAGNRVGSDDRAGPHGRGRRDDPRRPWRPGRG